LAIYYSNQQQSKVICYVLNCLHHLIYFCSKTCPFISVTSLSQAVAAFLCAVLIFVNEQCKICIWTH